MSTILVTGMAGGLARLVAQHLVARGEEVVGVDYRPVHPLSGILAKVKVHRANYNKTAIEDVFRSRRFDAVLHLGRVGNLKEAAGKRFDLNVVGSQKILNLCLQHGVSNLVVLSTFHIYGAHPANHIPIFEEEPLRAGLDFPQLADAIQLDAMAGSWVYKHPEVRCVVLRPTNVVGPTVQNTIAKFLRLRRIPHLAGFNPMMQFVHEEDLAEAICRAMHAEKGGVYNVAGQGAIPWRTAIDLGGASTFPLPTALARLWLDRVAAFPGYLLNFFKYPCIISDAAFREAFSWAPEMGIRESLTSTTAEVRLRRGG